MVTDLKIKISKQRSPILPLLIFAWILVVCFVSVDYYKESRFNEQLIDTYLYQFNLRVADAHRDGRNVANLVKNTYFGEDRVGLSIFDSEGNSVWSSTIEEVPTHLAMQMRPECVNALAEGRSYAIRSGSGDKDLSYIYSATLVDDTIYCSSLPYDTSAFVVLESEEVFILFIVGITLLMSIIGILMMKRFQHSVKALEYEHEQAMHLESEKTRLKKQLTNNINHELKTPISAIHGYLETILMNPTIDEKTRQNFIEKSFDHSNRVIGLLKDVSEITKMEEAEVAYEMSELNIKAMVDEIIENASLEIKDKSVRVATLVKSDVIIEGNKYLVHSIFGNLLDNSVAYSGARDISISAQRSGDYYEFKVMDNGIGIDEKHIPHLFERFYRVDTGRSRKIGGTGLGLSIVKNAVQLHGGTIFVTNRARGGLEFKFTLRIKNSKL